MIDYKGLSILTSNDVYEPAEDSFLAADVLEAEIKSFRHGKLRVLDMGTGSGILGLIAAKNKKVSEVVFADINHDAINLCNRNITQNKSMLKADCKTFNTNLFSKIEEDFDIIIFNAPYLRSEPTDIGQKLAAAWAGGKTGVELSIKFLEQAVEHMNTDCRIILVASSFSSIKRLKTEYARIGLKKNREKKIHISFEDIIALVLHE